MQARCSLKLTEKIICFTKQACNLKIDEWQKMFMLAHDVIGFYQTKLENTTIKDCVVQEKSLLFVSDI